MFQIMIIGPVKNLALTEVVQGFIELELIFCDKRFDVYFELILLASGDEFKALIVSLKLIEWYFLKEHFVNVLVDITVVDYLG